MEKLYCSFIISLLIQVNAFGQWEEIHLSDTSYFQQFEVHNLVESNGNLIALAGPLLRSSDEGASWVRLPFEESSHRLYSTSTILFLDTYDGQFFRSTDNGSTWTNIENTFLKYLPYPPPFPEYLVANINSFAFNSAEIFIGTDAGIFCSKDNGIHWTRSSKGLPNDGYNAHIIGITSLVINESNMYAGTQDKGIFVSTDNGNNWKSINAGLPRITYDSTRVFGIWALINNGETIFALVEDEIYRLLNGSNVWKKINNSISGTYLLACKNSVIFAVTTRGLYGSSDNGNNWNEVNNGSYFDSGFSGIMRNNSRLYLYGNSGVIMSSDNGITWISRNEGLGEFRIRHPSKIDVYNSILGVMTVDDKTFLSRDTGNNWENVTINETSINNYIDNDTIFFKLLSNFFVKKEGIWYSIPSWPTVDVVLVDTTLIGISETSAWRGVRCGSVNIYSIYNNEFRPVWDECLTGSSGDISLIVSGNNVYVAAGNGIYLSTNFGETWEQIGLQNKVVFNLVVSGSNIIAHTSDGFYKSFDGGYSCSPLYLGLDNIVKLELCGDNLISLASEPDYHYYKIWKRSFQEIITSLEKEQIIPDEFSLSQNYPNPFNPSTSIQYAVPQAGSSQGSVDSKQFVSLKVYDLLGREVATLVNEEKPAGSYEVEFSASNLASGIYFYKLQAGEYTEVKKMILMK